MRSNATNNGAADAKGGRTRRWRIPVALGLSALLAAAGTVVLKATGSAAPGTTPAAVITSHNGPLTSEESRKATRIAIDHPTSRRGAAGTGRERNAAGAAGAEPLDTHRPPRSPSKSAAPDGEAEVQLYDYASDSLITRRVDLRSGKVLASGRRHGVQPPPSLAEARQAVRILLADRRLGPGMRASYASATHRKLTSPAQLRLQGMAFLASRAEGVKGARQVSRCGAHRCVQLFVRIPGTQGRDGGRWIDTSRIVIDLSARRAAVIGL
ncbi:Tat pathway signal sequence domain protein [Streptomyces coffeae]|uniref:Tat pathway signal sequence domain protein n=1 Tax=Streptomyces coffeae TaxID=621382 RepID=A0ABS1NL52_9ACTN|nr:Tat pathway signal sequence domain protein [Streptomyces coffeae]MBL1100664.1 Tat pathway signal sequence domain protein [Streptomyces coffeae]